MSLGNTIGDRLFFSLCHWASLFFLVKIRARKFFSKISQAPPEYQMDRALAEHKFNLCLSPSSWFNHDDTRPPWGRRGFKVGNTSSVSPACRKRRLNMAVCRNHRIKRVVPCRCRTGTLKNPTKCLWRWEPDRKYKFFFGPPAHLWHHIYMYDWNIVACDVKHQ